MKLGITEKMREDYGREGYGEGLEIQNDSEQKTVLNDEW